MNVPTWLYLQLFFNLMLLNKKNVSIIYRSQREVVGTIRRIVTGYGKPYWYLLSDLSGHPLEYKFKASNLKPAPPINELKLTVNKILQKRGTKVEVSFLGWPR